MALMILGFKLDDYDEWKQVFDSDPGGRKGVATGHRISRSVEDPSEVFVAVEYASADDAKAVLERLRAAQVLDRYSPTLGPTITEVVEETKY